jgi:hypothetical protein
MTDECVTWIFLDGQFVTQQDIREQFNKYSTEIVNLRNAVRLLSKAVERNHRFIHGADSISLGDEILVDQALGECSL